MLHLDEGKIHELLDGELDVPEAASVRAHIAQCADCLRLYEEAQDMLAEADRVISSLSGTSAPRIAERDPAVVAATPAAAAAAAAPSPLPSPAAANVGAGTPFVLIPHNPNIRSRMPKHRTYFWAAGLVAVAGAGYLVFTLRQQELTRSSDVASRAFNSAPGEPAPSRASSPPTSQGTVAGLVGAPPAVSPTAAPKRAEARLKPPAPVTTQVFTAKPRRTTETAGNAAAPPAAALGAAEAKAAAPSPESLAQITSRIGLDEAKRELGGPLHGIDGLRPAFIGLVPGRLVPGADPSRDVVRAVYVDAGNRQFYLDQQRVSESGAAARGSAAADNALSRTSGLVRGDVQLILHGQVPADTLRSLEPRVR